MPEGRGTAMYLRDILEAMDDIGSFVVGMTFPEFREDRRTFHACVRNIEIMGEAVRNLPEVLKEEHDDVPWREVAGMRDKVVHAYFGVSTRSSGRPSGPGSGSSGRASRASSPNSDERAHTYVHDDVCHLTTDILPCPTGPIVEYGAITWPPPHHHISN
jgi:uncharacterized protein with HEPN domain